MYVEACAYVLVSVFTSIYLWCRSNVILCVQIIIVKGTFLKCILLIIKMHKYCSNCYNFHHFPTEGELKSKKKNRSRSTLYIDGILCMAFVWKANTTWVFNGFQLIRCCINKMLILNTTFTMQQTIERRKKRDVIFNSNHIILSVAGNATALES